MAKLYGFLRTICFIAVYFMKSSESLNWTLQPSNPTLAVEGQTVSLTWRYSLTANEQTSSRSFFTVKWSRFNYSPSLYDEIGSKIFISLLNPPLSYREPLSPHVVVDKNNESNSATVHINGVRRDDEGRYKIEYISDLSGTVVADQEVNVTISVLPALGYMSNDTDVCEGSLVRLSCNATGVPQPSITWAQVLDKGTDSAPLPAIDGTYVILDVNRSSNGTIYRCTAENGAGAINRTVQVTLKYSPSVDEIRNSSNTVTEGGSFNLTCATSGGPENYTWIRTDSGKQVSNEAILIFNNISRNVTGQYRCEAKNQCGNGSKVQSVDVYYKPDTVTLEANATENKDCSDVLWVNFTCVASEANPPVYNYQLFGNRDSPSQSKSGTWIKKISTEGKRSYSCLAQHLLGNVTNSINVTVSLNHYVQVQISANLITGSNTPKRGGDVALYCNASGFPEPSITWSKVFSNSLVEITSSHWLNFTNIKENKSGMYICQANNTCGKRNSSVISIKVLHAPENIMLSADSLNYKVCAGNAVQFTCKAGAANPEVERYTLYRNNTVIANMSGSGVSTLWLNTSGLYISKCKAKNSVGSGTSNSITFTVEVPPSITSVSPRTVIKEGEDVTLICNVTGDSAPNVVWVDARNQLTNGGATWKLPRISRKRKGEYICVASNACGSGNKTTTIDVQYPPSATDSGQNKTVRTGSSETLSCPVDGNPQPSITWYKEKDAGGTVLSRGKELKFVDINSCDTGCYTCSASNGLGKPINITQCLTFETSKVSWGITLIITNKDCKNFPEEEFRMEVAKLLEHLGLNSIETKTRCGSVIVDLGLGFNQSVDVNDVISTLKDAASDGKFGDFNVDFNSIRQTSLISTTPPSPTNREECSCSCNTVLWVIIGILVAIIIVLIIIIVWQNKKGTTKRPYEVPPHDAGFYDNGIAMEDISPTHVSPSSSTQKLSMSGPGYMDLQEVTRSDKYRTDQSRPTTSQQQNPSQPAEYAPLNLRTRSWEVATDNVTVDKIIGKGAFGQVAKGTAIQLPFSNGKTTVAVKMLKPNAPEADKKDLLSELELMKTLKPHPHIIKLMGCVTLSEPLLVLIEYVPYGDLLGYLRKSRGLNDTYYKDPDVKPQTSLTSQQLMKFAWQTADGMSYLSSRKIIHRDLAARNVLVGERETCKVTDFGMARDVQQEDIYEKKTRGRLPVKWTAYESLLYGTYTTKSDIWSYGVVLYEIFTIGGSPYPRMDGKRIANALQHGYRMPKPQHVDDALYQIMMNCWQKEPEARPSFPALTKQLKEMEKQHKRLINMRIYDNELYGNLEDLNV